MKTMKHYLGTFAAASMLLIAGAVNAAPISGDVSFKGGWTPLDAASNVVGIEDAVRVAFINPSVEDSFGDFAGSDGEAATYTDFTFDPFDGPITPLWSIDVDGTIFSFDLESVTVGFRTSSLLVLSGIGTVRATGLDSENFDPAEFFWEFSGNSTGVSLSFSAISANVPEPSVVGLLGLGLIAMGATGIRRRRAARQA